MKAYRIHRCTRHHSKGSAFMRCAFPRWIVNSGEGEFALIARGGGWRWPRALMYPTEEAARAAKASLEDTRDHYGYSARRASYEIVVVDLDAQEGKKRSLDAMLRELP